MTAGLRSAGAIATALAGILVAIGPATRTDANETTSPVENVAGTDTTWRANLKYLSEGSGIWIASNASYRTAENREPPSYGQRYWMGFGGTVQHGCLWGDYPSEQYVHWHFFTAWDPVKQQLLVHQAAPDGTVGLGYETPSSGIAEQTFTRVSGASWTSKHESTHVRPDTLVTKSFELVNGTWEPRRTYTWIRQRGDVRAPC